MAAPIGSGSMPSATTGFFPQQDQCSDPMADAQPQKKQPQQPPLDRVDVRSAGQRQAQADLGEIVDRYLKFDNVGRALGSGGLRDHRISVLGQIPDAQLDQLLAQRMGREDAARLAAELRTATAQHLVGDVAARVGRAGARLDRGFRQALESPAKRQALLHQMPVETRVPFLRSLGLDAATATAIARDPAQHDKPFRNALDDARDTLSDVAYVSRNAQLRADMAMQLFDNHRPVVSQLRAGLSIKRGSVADKAIATVMAQGRSTKRFNDGFKVGAGLVASAAVTISTLGAGIALPAICSAVGSGLMDAPAVMGATGQANRLRLLQHQGLVRGEEAARADAKKGEAVAGAVVGVVAAGAGSAASGLVVRAMPTRLPVGSLAASVAEVAGSTFSPELPKAAAKAVR